MRILVLSDQWLPYPGGAERYIYNVAAQLQARDNEIYVLTGYWDEHLLADNFESLVIAPHAGPPILDHRGAWESIARSIDRVSPNIVVTHHYWCRQFEAEFSKLSVPIVQLIHSGRRMPCAALAVYNSQYSRRIDILNTERHDTVILPTALPSMTATEHGSYIGFINPRAHKGVGLFYEIAKAMPTREFLVLRGETRERYTESVQDCPNVDYMDPIPDGDMWRFYSSCRIVLVPSEHDTAGTVPMECAVNLIPCISTDIEGLRETNHGIRLSAKVETWMKEITTLDDPDYFRMVIERQKRFYEHCDFRGAFDALDMMMRAIVAEHTRANPYV
jgi:glycosyltransferase involved in cell wall biosynthesis